MATENNLTMKTLIALICLFIGILVAEGAIQVTSSQCRPDRLYVMTYSLNESGSATAVYPGVYNSTFQYSFAGSYGNSSSNFVFSANETGTYNGPPEPPWITIVWLAGAFPPDPWIVDEQVTENGVGYLDDGVMTSNVETEEVIYTDNVGDGEDNGTSVSTNYNVNFPTGWENANFNAPQSINFNPGLQISGSQQTVTRNVVTIIKLQTGGMPTSTAHNLFQFYNSGANQAAPPFIPNDVVLWYDPLYYYNNYALTNAPAIPFQNVAIGGYGTMDALLGNLYTALPDNDDVVVTPTANVRDDTFYENNTKWPLVHNTECTAPGNPDNTRTTIGIGEAVDLSGMPAGTIWSVSGGTIRTNFDGSAVFTASQSPGSATVNAIFNNVPIPPLTFNIKAPTGVKVTGWTDLGIAGYITNGIPGSDFIGAKTKFFLQVLPDSVSFLKMTARECVPSYTFNWPYGIPSSSIGQTNPLVGQGCGYQFTDTVGLDDPVPIFRLVPPNGTNYVGISFPQTWKWQYLNQDQQWIDCATINLVETYNANAQAQETYQGQPGSWQGPWVQVQP